MADEANTAPQSPAATTTQAAPAAAPAPAAAATETPASTTPPAADKAPSTPATEVKAAESKPASALLSEEPKAKVDAPAGEPPAENTEAPAEKAKDGAAEEAKKDEAPKEGEPKKEEGSQSDELAPQPTYETFKVEDGFTVDAVKLGEFNGLLAEMELAKGDHTKMQEVGQKLVDRHVAEVKNILQQQAEYYVDAFKKQQNDWEVAFENDPEIGGNQRETTLEYARQFISEYGGTAEQQKVLRETLKTSGLANHPEFIRLFATARKSMTREGVPVPAQNLNTAPKSKVERRYGKMS